MSVRPPEAHLSTAAQIAGSDGIYLANSDKLRHMSFADWVKKP